MINILAQVLCFISSGLWPIHELVFWLMPKGLEKFLFGPGTASRGTAFLYMALFPYVGGVLVIGLSVAAFLYYDWQSVLFWVGAYLLLCYALERR